MNEQQTFTELPELHDFFINNSPYTTFEFTQQMKDSVLELIYTMRTLDCYCPECKSVSVFTPQDNRPKGPTGHPVNASGWSAVTPNSNAYVERRFNCSRNTKHIMNFYIFFKGYSFSKIGQYPSLADINSFDIKKYKKILGDDYFREFNKAIGLYSHGVGVGSFVYLRRIIENFIINPAYNLAKTERDWDEDKFQKARVREKIALLKENLPVFLTENSVLYSVVSKGIHELTEKECLEYFPILKSCLEFVLTELEEKRKTEEKRKELADKLSKIAGKINNGG